MRKLTTVLIVTIIISGMYHYDYNSIATTVAAPMFIIASNAEQPIHKPAGVLKTPASSIQSSQKNVGVGQSSGVRK